MENPLRQFAIHTLIPIHIGSYDVSFTNSSLLMTIAFALIVCGIALMHSLNIFDSQIVAQNIINGADSFPLMAVPFFMLAGELMNRGGLARRIVNVALALVGHVKGGLGYVTILASCVLASLSGSAAADAAAAMASALGVVLLDVGAGVDASGAGAVLLQAANGSSRTNSRALRLMAISDQECGGRGCLARSDWISALAICSPSSWVRAVTR